MVYLDKFCLYRSMELETEILYLALLSGLVFGSLCLRSIVTRCSMWIFFRIKRVNLCYFKIGGSSGSLTAG
jgi:hypothetical protein